MVFPAYEAGNGFSFFHACAFINPVRGLGASPIAATVEGNDTASANDIAFVGAAAAPVRLSIPANATQSLAAAGGRRFGAQRRPVDAQ